MQIGSDARDESAVRAKEIYILRLVRISVPGTFHVEWNEFSMRLISIENLFSLSWLSFSYL